MPEQPPRLLRQLLVHVLRDLPVASARSRTNSCRRRAGCVSPVARDRDRPLACCPDCPEVAFDGDVVESERKVQAHVLESSVLCGRKLLTPYDVSSWGYTTAALPVY